VQIYADAREADGVLLRRLCGFKRVALAPGETRTLDVALSPRGFQMWDEQSQSWRPHPNGVAVHVAFDAENPSITHPWPRAVDR
jgi:hypothetical protein